MKDLLGSLVNGPVLVKAFEAEWAARQAAEAADDEMDSGDMDSEDEDEDSADERPRKKAKVSPALAPIAPVKPKKAPAAPRPSTAGAQAGGAEEARPKKRGRPPKNAAANAARASPPSQPVHFTAPISTTASPVTPHATQQQFSFVPVVPQQQKRPAYLLAGFVFLSFFKPSPREVGIVPSDEGTNHSHLGRVLSSQDENPFGNVVASSWHSHPVLHVAHTALMIALFVALAVSLSPQSTKNKLWRYLDRLTSSAPAVEEQLDEKDNTMTPLERAEKELKCKSTSFRYINIFSLHFTAVSSNTKSKLRAFTLLQAIPTPTSEQLALMALLRFASKPSQATDLWAEAASCSDASNPTTVAFELPLETACTVLQEAASSRDHRSPLIIVASKALETRFEQTLKDAFVNDVSAICDKSYTPISSSEASKRAAAQEELVTRSFALGGRPAELVKTWEQACTGRADASSTSNNNDDSTGAVLIRVLTLMHRIFPAAAPSRAYVATGLGRLPSPPPSPLPREESIRMEKILRVGLDATVFHGKGADRCEEVQRARDMLISRLSQAARMRRLVALEEEQE
ncbi:hypothetical protein M408DRAFT_189807 [Serendipita vermifera MAFF 305830]|uniref:Uncharacterized protein n=1 Tax=Serendipita vermifera MAFF 305830 TaxID=933852 RepID=A0A0C2XVP8_SERVB|nr:hypothetical protein M408DRAFT_189807 [Serendipita vermifera MAFF 305830]